MSELINNSDYRKEELKKLILKLHKGISPDIVKEELKKSLKNIPYGEVVEVEQELIEEGMPSEEVLKLCDIHGEVLSGNIDLKGMMLIPPGHPIDIFKNENKEIRKEVSKIRDILVDLFDDNQEFEKQIIILKQHFNNLMDVDKHYQRKEHLVFPYLEKRGITGVPKVMWGKHDEIRESLKGSIEILKTLNITKDDFVVSANIIIKPALKMTEEMIMKEEEILFPMCMDQITEAEWWEIQKQTLEYGFCLYDPQTNWKPKNVVDSEPETQINKEGNMQMPSGSFSAEELTAILNILPVDITFVDKNDKVKYFSQNKDRIFSRSRAIINRDVRYCHPPSSVDIVDKIINDFKTGIANHAPFWIQLHGKFILIEYFAIRDNNENYLGTLEVSQDINKHRSLEGEQRILSYSTKKD